MRIASFLASGKNRTNETMLSRGGTSRRGLNTMEACDFFYADSFRTVNQGHVTGPEIFSRRAVTPGRINCGNTG